MPDAIAYSDFILQNIKQKELFSWLYIEPTRYWLNLMFLDNSNFGGILHEISNSNEKHESESKIISNWNINEHLPKPIQPHFLLIISDFILQIFKQRHFSEETREETETSDKSTNLRDSGTVSEPSTPSSLINSYLHQKMFKIIEDIQNTLSGQADEEIEDSEPTVSVAPKSANPALDFIKSVCHVLALDTSLQSDVFRLRKVNVSNYNTNLIGSP